MFTPINNHVQQALARLLQQYANSPNIQNLITALVNPIQDIESELTDMNNLRYLPEATGAQLDIIGSIVGIARISGQSDASYLNSIYGQITINTSQGQPEQVIQAFSIFTGADMIILYEALAAVMIETTWVPGSQTEVDTLITNMMQVTSAGVRFDGIIVYDPTMAFAYDGVLQGLGYDDGSQTVGGEYPTLYQFIGGGFAYDGTDPTGLGYGSIHDPLVGGVYLT